MAKSALKYLVRTGEGKEYGPVEQETVIQWARTGRITTECQVRSTVLKRWMPAAEINFLEGLVSDPEEEVEKALTVSDRFQRLVTKQAVQPKTSRNPLAKRGIFKFDGAGAVLRCLAWVFDTALCGAVGVVGFVVTLQVVDQGVLARDEAYSLFTLLFFLFVVLYYTILVAYRAQTFGQWFWGLMVVRTHGEPVLMARALWFTILHLLLFWSTGPFTIVVPTRRALQDKLSGVRVVRTSVRS